MLSSKLIPVIQHGTLHAESTYKTPMKSTTSDKDSFNRINASNLNRIIHTQLQTKASFLFDCRFPFEYRAGHIPFAINAHNPNDLLKMLFETCNFPSKPMLVFHCEFSSKRGPDMYL